MKNLVITFIFLPLLILSCNQQNSKQQIPEILGEYTLIYKPQPDVFTLNDTKSYKEGATYTKWKPNDHTFIKGPDNRWHCFGITKPDNYTTDEIHEGEGLCFHAIAPNGEFKDVLISESWLDQPKFSTSGSGWAPYGLRTGDVYSLVSSNKGHAQSKDLFNWIDKGDLLIKGKGRDPNVIYFNKTYYYIRCNDTTIDMVTSKDFINWTDPITIFNAPNPGWHLESPSLLRHNGTFYLFWCLWDSSGKAPKLPSLYDDHDADSFDYRTYVYTSDDPTNFHNKKPIAELKAHAPEIIKDENGDFYISSADYPQRGINVARLIWKVNNK